MSSLKNSDDSFLVIIHKYLSHDPLFLPKFRENCAFLLLFTTFHPVIPYFFTFLFFFVIHHCKNSLSSLHIYVHYCTFCASLHVKTIPGGSPELLKLYHPRTGFTASNNYNRIILHVVYAGST